MNTTSGLLIFCYCKIIIFSFFCFSVLFVSFVCTFKLELQLLLFVGQGEKKKMQQL